MRKHAPTMVLVLAALALVSAVVFTALRGRGEDSHVDAGRPAELRDRLPEARAAAERAVNHYSPPDPAPITDPATPAAELLRGLPGVAKVEVLVQADRPKRRIIHIRDWHAVPRDLYGADLKVGAGRDWTEAELDLRHRELLLEAALVQHEQLALLRCLARRHGLKRVLAEGLTPEGVRGLGEALAGLRGVEAEAERVCRALADLRGLVAGREGGKAQELQADALALLGGLECQLAEAGVAVRLLAAGELAEVLPLDDAQSLEAARPVRPAGKVGVDPAKLQARQDALVRAALQAGPVAVLVLGGAHDLSGAVRRLAPGDCEYLRITTRLYAEFTERRGR